MNPTGPIGPSKPSKPGSPTGTGGPDAYKLVLDHISESTKKTAEAIDKLTAVLKPGTVPGSGSSGPVAASPLLGPAFTGVGAGRTPWAPIPGSTGPVTSPLLGPAFTGGPGRTPMTAITPTAGPNQVDRLLTTLERLGEKASRGSWTQQDLAKDVAKALEAATRQTRYKAMDRLGLERTDTSATVTKQLMYGHDHVADMKAEEERTRSRNERRAAESRKREDDSDRNRPWQEDQERLMRRASQYSMAGFGSVGHRMAHYGAMAEGLKGLGMGGAASALQGAAGPLAFAGAATSAAVQATTQGARIYNDPYLTDSQKGRAAFRMLPGGETAQKLVDALSGREGAIAKAHEESAKAAARISGEMEERRFKIGFEPRQAGLAATAQAYRSAEAVVPRVFDRGTARGEIQHADEMRMLPYRKESAKAEREMASATADRVSASKKLEEITARQRTNAMQLADAEKAVRRGGSGVERAQAVFREANLIDESKELIGLGKEAAQRRADATNRESSARAARDTARIHEEKLGQADVLEAKAQRTGSTASRLGRMDPYQRALGDQALDMLQGGVNPDFLSPEMRAAAEAFAPEEVDKIYRRTGQNTAQFKKRQAQGMGGFEGDPAEFQKQADTLRAEAGKETYAIETRAATEFKEAGERLGDEIVKLVRSGIDSAIRKVINERLLGRAGG